MFARTVAQGTAPREREPPCAVFAIHDDNYVAVPLEQANAVARIVDETFEEEGLQLNPNKSKIVSNSPCNIPREYICLNRKLRTIDKKLR